MSNPTPLTTVSESMHATFAGRSGSAETLGAALVALPPSDLIQLDALLRTSWKFEFDWPSVATRWGCRLRAPLTKASAGKSLELLTRFGDSAWAPAAILSCNPNGFIRHASIEFLAELREKQAIPFLLLRANDWVEPVREAAEQALAGFYPMGCLDDFVRVIPLVVRLETSRAARQQSISTTIRKFLQDPVNTDCLIRGLQSSDAAVRRFCVDVGLAATAPALLIVQDICFQSADPLLRYRALQAFLVSGGAKTEHDRLLTQLADPYMPVRREALSALRQDWLLESREVFIDCLLDRSPAIRGLARLSLAQIAANLDVSFCRNIYFDRLTRGSTPSVVATALIGLGATGTVEDVPFVLSFVKHPLPSVRRAALRALAKLDAANSHSQFVDALLHEVPSVSVAARQILATPSLLPHVESLKQFLASQYTRAAWDGLIWLARRHSKWDWIELLLTAAVGPTCPDPKRIEREADDWMARFNRSWSAPKPGQLESIRKLLAAAATRLPADQVARLEFYLR